MGAGGTRACTRAHPGGPRVRSQSGSLLVQGVRQHRVCSREREPRHPRWENTSSQESGKAVPTDGQAFGGRHNILSKYPSANTLSHNTKHVHLKMPNDNSCFPVFSKNVGSVKFSDEQRSEGPADAAASTL